MNEKLCVKNSEIRFSRENKADALLRYRFLPQITLIIQISLCNLVLKVTKK
jgi:hypothetical protein